MNFFALNYDPLGFINQFFVLFKCLFQQLYLGCRFTYKVLQKSLCEKQQYAKFGSFEFRRNRLSIKTKERQLRKQNIFRLRTIKNFQTRTESEQKSCQSKICKEDDKKKEKPEKRKSSDTCVAKLIYHSGTSHWI